MQFVRKITQNDEKLLEDFLIPHTPFVYFMRSNAKKAGLNYEGKEYQADYFAYFENDKIKGVLAHHWIGSLQIFAPIKSSRALLTKEFLKHLQANPRDIKLILGPQDHCQDICDIYPSSMNIRKFVT